MKDKRIREEPRWQTSDELKYLRHIGTWSDCITLSKKGMIENYIKTTFSRENWDEVDRDTVRSYARDMLREL